MNEHLISQVPLFSALPSDEIQQLAETLHVREFPADEIVFREGQYGDRFYVIREGEIEIVKSFGTVDERRISVRGPGEYVGEMSLLNPDGLRTATVRTRTAVQLLEMTRADFDALLARQPSMAYQMVRVLSSRLNYAHNAAINDLHAKNRQLAQAYDELKDAQAQIIEKEKLEHELNVARQVQASLMPQSIPALAGWEFAAHWQPARQVSGDFYDFIPGRRGQLGLVIADVADKGMPSAIFMALSRSILRASVTQALAPLDGMMQANRLICADSTDSMFVTLCYALLDAATDTVLFINAGHNPPLSYRAAEDHLDWLTQTGMPMGIDPDAILNQRSLILASGDFILLYTDGVTDSIDESGHEFGAKRLWQVVYDNRRASAVELTAALQSTVDQFTGTSQPIDDITIVAAKRL